MHTELSSRIRRSLFDRELILRDGVISLAGIQNHRGEFRLVGRIGKVLGFEAEGIAARIGHAAFAGSFSVQEISGVKLHARLGGPNFQDAARGGLDDARGGKRWPELIHGAYYKIMIVAAAEF